MSSGRAGGRLKVAGFIALVLVGISALASTQSQPRDWEDGPTENGVVNSDTDSVGVSTSDDSTSASADWSLEDWDVFESKVRWASSVGLDQADLGESISRLALSFVGTTYTPGTLEADGPERLVINFRELDCVTFVETVLAMTHFVREGGETLLDDPAAARASYERHLTDLRYRGGKLDGYPSRLHYFSEWLADNDSRGLVRTITAELDHEIDEEPIMFMSSHPTAYRQLAEEEVLQEIEAMEAGLNARGGRAWIPAERITDVAAGIQNGDVIAATSTVEGLDVAHTGLAVWVDDELRLIHAPLVGRTVELSKRPLADRILSISGQDGIMVARPTGS